MCPSQLPGQSSDPSGGCYPPALALEGRWGLWAGGVPGGARANPSLLHPGSDARLPVLAGTAGDPKPQAGRGVRGWGGVQLCSPARGSGRRSYPALACPVQMAQV